MSSGLTAKGAPTNNQRGRGSGPCRLWQGFDMARHIVHTALLVRVQCISKILYKLQKGQTQDLSSSRWNLGLTDHVEGCSIFLSSRDAIYNAFEPSFVYKFPVEDRVSDSFWYIFLKRLCTSFGQKFRVFQFKVLVQRMSYWQNTVQGIKRLEFIIMHFASVKTYCNDSKYVIQKQDVEGRIQSSMSLYSLLVPHHAPSLR